jgi:hypothetical protein
MVKRLETNPDSLVAHINVSGDRTPPATLLMFNNFSISGTALLAAPHFKPVSEK